MVLLDYAFSVFFIFFSNDSSEKYLVSIKTIVMATLTSELSGRRLKMTSGHQVTCHYEPSMIHQQK